MFETAKMLAKGTLDQGPTGVHVAQMRLDPSPLRRVCVLGLESLSFGRNRRFHSTLKRICEDFK